MWQVICHGIPDCRPIEDGDIINLDVTVYIEYKGKCYHGDLNETYFVGYHAHIHTRTHTHKHTHTCVCVCVCVCVRCFHGLSIFV